MRKMKKINGYLVVKFNARELREYEGTALGEYGVIDAELYTGNLDVDRGAMEYDNAGSMEEAVELARGLESELDAEEPEVKVTIVKETDETTEEEEVDAQQMIAGWENVLRGRSRAPTIRTWTSARQRMSFTATRSPSATWASWIGKTATSSRTPSGSPGAAPQEAGGAPRLCVRRALSAPPPGDVARGARRGL